MSAGRLLRHLHPSARTRSVRRRAAGLLTALALALSTVVVPAAGAGPAFAAERVADQVVPVSWSTFGQGLPTDPASTLAQGILLDTNRYALSTWYPARYGSQTGAYLNLGGNDEQSIRQPAGEAMALAISLQTGAYDPAHTGVPTDEATRITLRLIGSVAKSHLSNSTNGWGNVWQSALWAYYAGYAGWLMWDQLGDADRADVQNMVEYEADRFLNYAVPYYQDSTGRVVSPGDTKAEENSWNADLTSLATAMLPNSQHWGLWMQKNLELIISSFSRPSDLSNTTTVNGKEVRDWLKGSNILENGTLVNHAIIHPDYMTTVEQNTSAALTYGLAGMATPQAALFNADVVYNSLVDTNFTSPPYRAPGGTIYVHDAAAQATPAIYYPQGNDWGTGRRMHFVLVDAQAQAFGFDNLVSIPGSAWEEQHAATAAQMQSRFTDGRTYGASSEDTYAGREQWVAVMAGQTYLTHWLTHQGPVKFTNRAYPVTPKNSLISEIRPTSLPGFFPPGTSRTVTTTMTTNSPEALKNVMFAAQAPSGWTVTADPMAVSHVEPGGSVTTTWTITPPPAIAPGSYAIRLSDSFTTMGENSGSEVVVTAVVPPPAPTGQVWVSDVPWLAVANGYGPVHLDQNLYGNPLSIGTTTYAKGIWTNAPAKISYYLGGRCTALSSDVGIDESMNAYGTTRGTVTFQVWGDGVKLYDSGLVNGATPAVHLDVDMSNVQQMDLVVTNGGDGQSYDHGDWGGAQLSC